MGFVTICKFFYLFIYIFYNLIVGVFWGGGGGFEL